MELTAEETVVEVEDLVGSIRHGWISTAQLKTFFHIFFVFLP